MRGCNAGPIPMFIGSELFRQGPRPKAMAVVGIALWIAAFIIAIGFEPLQVTTSGVAKLERARVQGF